MKSIKVLTLGAAVASALLSTAATAGLSGNIGLTSQYYFRGVQQTAGAAGSAGIDYEHDNGAYAGVWASDVGGHGDAETDASDGIETDYYLGYGGEQGDISYGIGYTIYTYTGDFDTEYNEVNLSGGYGPVSVEFSIGTRDGGSAGPDLDYTFAAVSYEYKSLTATYGIWGDEFEGAYFELGFSKTVSEIDFGVSLINGDTETNPDAGNASVSTDGTALIFTIGKSFDI